MLYLYIQPPPGSAYPVAAPSGLLAGQATRGPRVPTPSHEIAPALAPPSNVRALLFDCDGTLLDTLGVYKESWRVPFGQRGFDITDEWFYARAGLAMDPFILAALPHLDLAELRQVEREGMDSFFEQLHSVERFETSSTSRAPSPASCLLPSSRQGVATPSSAACRPRGSGSSSTSSSPWTTSSTPSPLPTAICLPSPAWG